MVNRLSDPFPDRVKRTDLRTCGGDSSAARKWLFGIVPGARILGVIAGALMVLQLMPLVPEVTRAFWLGAVGALFLGSWPGGRGPAWETGHPDPWPSAADRRGLVPAGGAAEEAAGGANGAKGANGASPSTTPAEPEPVPQRPSSRKRRRKKR